MDRLVVFGAKIINKQNNMDIPLTTNYLSSSNKTEPSKKSKSLTKESLQENINIEITNSIDKHSNLFKTEICRAFQDNGRCRYGSKCQFAHNLNELREINRHPRYKTQYCKKFNENGFCPYGTRCCFIHEKDCESYDGLFSKSMIIPFDTKKSHNVYSKSLDSMPTIPHYKQVTDFSIFLDRTPGHPLELKKDKEDFFTLHDIIDATNLLPTDVMFMIE